MNINFFPPIVRVFPGDRQLFTLRASSPPPLWRITTGNNGYVRPDYTVRKSPTGSLNTAYGALGLITGLGSIEWTLVAECIPTGGSQLVFTIDFINPTSGLRTYTANLHATDLTITSESATLAVLPYTPAVGDVFRIDLGNGFRLYINGMLRHERITGLTPLISYPAYYLGTFNGTPLAGGPGIVPAPRLGGDWRLLGSRPFVSGDLCTFVAPSHGSISHVTGTLKAEYFNGSVPGQYTLAAFVDTGRYQWMTDAIPSGGAQITSGGDAWTFVTTNPTPFSGSNSHKSSNIAGDHSHGFQNATLTMSPIKDDVLYCYVFPDTTNPTTEIMLEWQATDGSGFAHRAYWGANSIALGTDGTVSRWFMGPLPTAGQWTRLEAPAELVGMVGRVASGMNFRIFGGQCSFDEMGLFAGKLQRAEAIIIIPPLEILGDSPRTQQPDVPVRFRTNYDIAQNDIVTWSVISGGGSFNQNEFFTPSAPGTTVVRATSGNQTADLTINVPAVITPNFFAIGPSETIDWNTNIVSPTWTASAGTINSGTGEWIAPSGVGQTVIITATDGTNTVSVNVVIMDLFPFSDFALPFSWDRRKTVLISRAEDRSRTARVKDKDGLAFEAFEVRMKNRTVTELQTVHDFWDSHYPSKRFILQDNLRNIRKIVYFDSDIRQEGNTKCGIDISFRLIEA